MAGPRVVILGTTGMVGGMIYDYLSKHSNLFVEGTERDKFDADRFLTNPEGFTYLLDFDYLINCIGIIKPYCKDDDPEGVRKAIEINSLFPHKLAKFCQGSKVKIIQIATDCVFSGKKGNYNEDSSCDPQDVYGMTKSLGEVFYGNFLNIRCSVIGPERGRKSSLLEWFLDQPNGSEVKGYAHHKWNGVTSLQFAKLCSMIISNDKFDDLIKINHTHHFVPNNTVTKFGLLTLFAKIFRKKIKVKPLDIPPPAIDRTLSTRYDIISSLFPAATIENALEELKEYI